MALIVLIDFNKKAADTKCYVSQKLQLYQVITENS